MMNELQFLGDNMNYLINEVIDRHDKSYKLFLELTDSGSVGYVDIRFYSTYSGANNPEAEQTKLRTTLPLESVFTIKDSLSTFLMP